jgi:TPR repeat protein
MEEGLEDLPKNPARAFELFRYILLLLTWLRILFASLYIIKTIFYVYCFFSRCFLLSSLIVVTNRQAADCGMEEAQMKVAFIFAGGLTKEYPSVAPSDSQAFTYFSYAANQHGNPAALIFVATAYPG